MFIEKRREGEMRLEILMEVWRLSLGHLEGTGGRFVNTSETAVCCKPGKQIVNPKTLELTYRKMSSVCHKWSESLLTFVCNRADVIYCTLLRKLCPARHTMHLFAWASGNSPLERQRHSKELSGHKLYEQNLLLWIRTRLFFSETLTNIDPMNFPL